MLSAARAAASARVTEAELETARARSALQSSLRFQTPGPMRPSDVPLVGPYHTFYEQIFGNRSNVRAFEIDRLMPLRVKTINDWVVTVHSGTGAAHSAEQAHAQGAVDLRTVLACHDAVREHRRKFLEAVYQYNCDIAEYAALASPAGTTAEKYVGMLIPTKGPDRITSLPARPTLPQGTGSPRQLPAGQQQTAGGRQLPWGDGWVASQQQQPPQQLRPSQPPAQPSYGATGHWDGSAGAGNNGAVAPPSGGGANPNRQADPFEQPRYPGHATPVR
jgi:hypothetical protein